MRKKIKRLCDLNEGDLFHFKTGNLKYQVLDVKPKSIIYQNVITKITLTAWEQDIRKAVTIDHVL